MQLIWYNFFKAMHVFEFYYSFAAKNVYIIFWFLKLTFYFLAVRLMSSKVQESDAEFDARYEAFFNRCVGGWAPCSSSISGLTFK